MADAPFTYGKTAMLFPTPVVSYTLGDTKRLNAALIAEIETRRQSDRGVVRSNRAGWHSASDFFARKEPAHAEVAKAIHLAVADATRRMRGPHPDKEVLRFQINGWINVNPPGAYNVPHDHPGSFWSGCYYIKTDGGRKKDDEGGSISFIDPRCAPSGQPLMRTPIFKGNYSVCPPPGELLVFPSNVKHWVHPNTSDEDRITMAFNVFILGAKPERGAA